jgi:hypothetical protein
MLTVWKLNGNHKLPELLKRKIQNDTTKDKNLIILTTDGYLTE